MNHFAYPQALWLLLVLPWLGLLAFWARLRRRRALTRLGNLLILQRSAMQRSRWQRLRQACLVVGLVLLIVGSAGPRWGRDSSPETVSGRDIVVVLDLSRSMRAEPKSRQERAVAALQQLCDTVEKRGGHRLALVVFAAHAKILCPLTHDYGHFRNILKELVERRLVPDIYPDKKTDVSGTRIGAALEAAVQLHDPLFEGAQDILLLSDGDDPADDQEWRQGIIAARAAHIPVDAVGVGDPETAWPIPTEAGPLHFDEKLVKSKLQEEPLRDIAAQTHGTYIPLRNRAMAFGKLYHEVLANRERQRDNDDGSLLVYQQRYPWFLGPAFVLLALTMLIGNGRAKAGGKPRFRWLLRKRHTTSNGQLTKSVVKEKVTVNA